MKLAQGLNTNNLSKQTDKPTKAKKQSRGVGDDFSTISPASSS